MSIEGKAGIGPAHMGPAQEEEPGSPALDEDGFFPHVKAHPSERLDVLVDLKEARQILPSRAKEKLLIAVLHEHRGEFLEARHEEIHIREHPFEDARPVRAPGFAVRVHRA